MKPKFNFHIDVLGSCNLKCPSCPQGNSRDVPVPTGFMDPELLRKIMAKATTECDVGWVGLFNWTEPLLHPKLPELVDIVQSHGVPCLLSSNLNFMRDMDELLAKNPSRFRISLSGFTQPVYERTHKGGDIEEVKANMRLLAEAKRRTGSTTKIHVLYHRYLGNLDDEVLMRDFALGLGFDFEPVWAFMMPVEKILAYVDYEKAGAPPLVPSQPNGRGQTNGRRKRRLSVLADAPPPPSLSAEDVELVDRLALPLGKALDIGRRSMSRPCVLRDEQMTIDFEGNVALCCGIYDPAKYRLSKFLDLPHAELQAKKYTHDGCSSCMDNGVHVYLTYGMHPSAAEFEALAKSTVARHYADKGMDFSETAAPVNVKRLVAVVKQKARGVKRRVARVREKLRTFVA
jgi:hypothetical protein